jgi:hypothetical protein
MTADQLEALCDAAGTGATEVVVVVPGRSSRGAGRRVCPGLNGKALYESRLPDGSYESRVAVTMADAQTFIRRARCRAAFHGEGGR